MRYAIQKSTFNGILPARIYCCQCRFSTSKCCYFSLEFNQNWCSTNFEISRFECFVAFYTKDKEFKQIFMSIEYHLFNTNMFRFCNISGPLHLFWICILLQTHTLRSQLTALSSQSICNKLILDLWLFKFMAKSVL